MLNKESKLINLDLSSNEISGEGIKNFFNFFPSKRLENLKLDNNNFGKLHFDNSLGKFL